MAVIYMSRYANRCSACSTKEVGRYDVCPHCGETFIDIQLDPSDVVYMHEEDIRVVNNIRDNRWPKEEQ